MDSFDKKVSDIFNSDSHDQVPTEFSWSEMNGGIYEKLEAEEPKRRPIIWFWLGGFISVIILSLTIWNFGVEEPNQKVSKNVEPNINVHSEKTISNLKITKINPIITAQEEVKSEHKINTESKRYSNDNIPKSITNSKAAIEIEHHINTIQGNQEAKNKYLVQKKKLDEVQIINPQNDINNSQFTPRKIENLSPPTSINIIDRPVIEITNLKTTNSSLLDFSRRSIIIESVKIEKKIKVDQLIANTKKVNSPTLYAGSLLGTGQYEGVDDRSVNSTWLPGYYVGARVPLLSGEKYTLYTGFEHKFAVQKFEINSTKKVLIPIKDALVHTSTNALTGQQSHTYGDTVGLSEVTHNYKNYNTFRSNTLNLGIKRSANLGPFEISLSAGASYSFLILSKGKTIGNDFDIIEYNTAQPIFLKSNWGVEGGVDINISLSKKLGINFHARGEQSLTNWSLEKDITLKPSFIKLGAGLKYTL